MEKEQFRRIQGTSLKGYIDINYSELESIFGVPYGQSGDDKVLCMWIIPFGDEQIATIYNYKDGVNYKETGLSKEDIKTWHIGGKHPSVINYIKSIFPQAKVTNIFGDEKDDK